MTPAISTIKKRAEMNAQASSNQKRRLRSIKRNIVIKMTMDPAVKVATEFKLANLDYMTAREYLLRTWRIQLTITKRRGERVLQGTAPNSKNLSRSYKGAYAAYQMTVGFVHMFCRRARFGLCFFVSPTMAALKIPKPIS